MIEMILQAILAWCATGITILLLLYYVYFRGVRNAFQHYMFIEKDPKKVKEYEEIIKECQEFVLFLGIIISGSIFGPLCLFRLMTDFYNFSLKRNK